MKSKTTRRDLLCVGLGAAGALAIGSAGPRAVRAQQPAATIPGGQNRGHSAFVINHNVPFPFFAGSVPAAQVAQFLTGPDRVGPQTAMKSCPGHQSSVLEAF